ncbi:MAG: hypothetical protein ACMUIP_18050 [bacterium]
MCANSSQLLLFESATQIWHASRGQILDYKVFVANFNDDKDSECFSGILENVVIRFNWVVHAYCMMDNHYHLFFETVDGILQVCA